MVSHDHKRRRWNRRIRGNLYKALQSKVNIAELVADIRSIARRAGVRRCTILFDGKMGVQRHPVHKERTISTTGGEQLRMNQLRDIRIADTLERTLAEMHPGEILHLFQKDTLLKTEVAVPDRPVKHTSRIAVDALSLIAKRSQLLREAAIRLSCHTVVHTNTELQTAQLAQLSGNRRSVEGYAALGQTIALQDLRAVEESKLPHTFACIHLKPHRLHQDLHDIQLCIAIVSLEWSQHIRCGRDGRSRRPVVAQRSHDVHRCPVEGLAYQMRTPALPTGARNRVIALQGIHAQQEDHQNGGGGDRPESSNKPVPAGQNLQPEVSKQSAEKQRSGNTPEERARLHLEGKTNRIGQIFLREEVNLVEDLQ